MHDHYAIADTVIQQIPEDYRIKYTDVCTNQKTFPMFPQYDQVCISVWLVYFVKLIF